MILMVSQCLCVSKHQAVYYIYTAVYYIYTYLSILPQLSCGKTEKWKTVPLDSDILKK